jgi:acyl carrier protein
MTSFRPEGDKAWNYVRERDVLSPFLKWIPRGPNLYECTVIDGWPAKVQSNQPDGSYHTKDLFEPHPTIPRAWKYIARLDDTIVLVNGEKFGPVSMEGAIRSSKHITEAVVFGSGRPNLGVLIVPASHLADKTQEQILDVVWPVVEAANQTVDAFGRISRNMIRLLPSDCVYPRTDKGSIIRQAFYRTFKDEIDETYDAQDTSRDDAAQFTLPDLKAYLRGLLAKTLKTPADVQDDTDFFLLGLDSLQAIQMRSEILRTVDIGGQKLGQNVVFDQPSVDKLSKFLYALSRGEEASQEPSIEAQMEALINKYGNVSASPASAVVSLTPIHSPT